MFTPHPRRHFTPLKGHNVREMLRSGPRSVSLAGTRRTGLTLRVNFQVPILIRLTQVNLGNFTETTQ